MSLNIGILASSRSTATGGSLLLDTYGSAAAAYSLRKLRSAYTGFAIRVTRGIDATQMDIGFVNGELDTSTLLTFVGGVSANSQVVTWYDQSGNGNNATIPAASAPYIIISAVLQTLGTKPVIRFSPNSFFNIGIPIVANTNISIFMTGKGDSLSLNGCMLGNPSGPAPIFGITNFAPTAIFNGSLNGAFKGLTATGSWQTANYNVTNIVVNATNYYPYQNNTAFGFTSTSYSPVTTSFSYIGRYSSFYSTAKYAELIFYKTDQLSNRTAIVNNTNSFYTIF